MANAERVAFVDSNILLYLLSANAEKADRAAYVLAMGPAINVQVLNEIANVCHRKLGMAWPEIDSFLSQVCSRTDTDALTVAVHERARQVAQRYGFAFYAAAIVAAALASDCTVLYSEDMQDGQRINDVMTIRNPFAGSERHEPSLPLH